MVGVCVATRNVVCDPLGLIVSMPYVLFLQSGEEPFPLRRPKNPLGSGSIEASLIIRYKDAIKACVSTMCVRERAFMDEVTYKFAPSQPPSLKMEQPTSLECSVFFYAGSDLHTSIFGARSTQSIWTNLSRAFQR